MKCLYSLLFLALMFALPLYAQDTVYVTSDFPPGEGNLNTAIEQNISNLNSKVFKLETAGIYILSGTITVPSGQHLRIVADDYGTSQATAPPQILWTSSSAPDTRFNFDCFGDMSMKNVWLSYVRTDGSQVGSSLEFEDNGTPEPERGTFEGVIFDYSPSPQNASGAVGVTSPHFIGKFTNCYFRNCFDTHFRYYGRAVSFPFGTTDWHIDSVMFVNCTFANMGYVYMQEAPEYGDFVWFNHCTFINTAMYTLESSFWWWCSVTNSVFQNAYMFGDIIAQRGGGTQPNGGALTIDTISTFGFTVPFTENERHILFAHNSYFIEQWLRDYMAGGNPYSDTASADYLPHPQPMMNERTMGIFNDDVTWPHASTFNTYDDANPGFLLPPTNMERIKIFLLKKWTDNSDIGWGFDTAAVANGAWPVSENLRYTNATLRTAGMGGFPLGDLYHWDKAQYNAWKAQEASENATITNWLTNGVTAVGEDDVVPTSFELRQNYPNPFNPTTQISYSLPEKGHVTLKVYDVLGMEVATLVSGVREAGTYNATFDATRVSSGIYFYRLEAGSVSITKKMIFMK
jgi:Secretion system C-terminal sorting domain